MSFQGLPQNVPCPLRGAWDVFLGDQHATTCPVSNRTKHFQKFYACTHIWCLTMLMATSRVAVQAWQLRQMLWGDDVITRLLRVSYITLRMRRVWHLPMHSLVLVASRSRWVVVPGRAYTCAFGSYSFCVFWLPRLLGSVRFPTLPQDGWVAASRRQPQRYVGVS